MPEPVIVPEAVEPVNRCVCKVKVAFDVKVAVTALLELTLTTHVALVPLHAPPHPANAAPAAGEAIKVNEEPSGKPPSQSEPHEIPAGAVVIEPSPVFETSTRADGRLLERR